jgi:acetylornithine deacetylase
MLRYKDEIVQVMRDLIRIPSQNTPPVGQEKACQEYIANYLVRAGLKADMYEPDQVSALVKHPAFLPGRNYRDRPNVSSLLPGKGGGRSLAKPRTLLLTGHVDTVALGDNVWSRPPFGAEIHDGRLYGLGAIDMKAALGAMLVLYKAIAEQQIPLAGALSFESVVDEEEGGVNATIAGRLRHGPLDGAVIPEGTDLKIYPAARGALISDIIFTSTKGTWLEVGTSGEQKADAVYQMGLFLSHLPELSAKRRSHPVHPLYTSYPDPVPVQVTKVYAGGWGSQVPIAVPPQGRIELILQTMPGEKREDVLREQEEWLASIIAQHPDAFATRPETRFRLRWMVPTAIDPAHPLVTTMADSVAQVAGQAPAVVGAPYACDMFALHQIFQMPALLFGPTGAQAHAADEYVELDSVFAFWESLLLFVLAWCGTEG